MENTLMTVVGGIIILGLVVLAIAIRLKSKPSSDDKEAAENFIRGLSEAFYQKMLEIVNEVDVTKFTNIGDLEIAVLNDIYDSIWDYTSDKLSEAAKEDILTALTLKVINKDYVFNFVDKIIKNANISEKLVDKWNANFEEAAEKLSEEDKKLQDKFSNENEYVENSEDITLEPAEPNEPTEEELAALNPPKDVDEMCYDLNDLGVELIEEEDTYVDAKGRKRSKATGRFV